MTSNCAPQKARFAISRNTVRTALAWAAVCVTALIGVTTAHPAGAAFSATAAQTVQADTSGTTDAAVDNTDPWDRTITPSS
ncbi:MULTISPECIES: hypothetical protein [unclassified Streptomyces]|jgi:hypothetical protein|uniref:hypothetical protein n=1 Tax=unclassified Streptomyces TaxID=2593676 RepID=UPI00224CBB67|nr:MULTISPECIES: hypothetical protein [unclassified Streptomyces]MCX4409562.1 hypothetical protein [Streptomyces sp. NBC_01764]MCX5191333.1 hypothetical protein [Streptomyces sp. NBC_00268]